MESALRLFFSSSRYAVAGASSGPAKFGNKILGWYISRKLPVTPINARSPEVSFTAGSGERHTLVTVPTPEAVTASEPYLSSGEHARAEPESISLSVVTPPAVTLAVLESARAAGIRRVWLQPGTFDANCLAYLSKLAADSGTAPAFEAVIVPGYNRNMALQESVPGEQLASDGAEGWCVLVDGDRAVGLARGAAKF